MDPVVLFMLLMALFFVLVFVPLRRLGRSSPGLAVCIFGGWLIATMAVSFIPPVALVRHFDSAAVYISDVSGRAVEVRLREFNLWRWDERLDRRYGYWVELTGWQNADTMEAHPITENPKVRELKYEVSWMYPAPGDHEGWTALLHELRGETPQVYLKRQLYEFNELRSRELSVLYNPLDSEQQWMLRLMLEEFLDPALKKTHLRISGARFTM